MDEPTGDLDTVNTIEIMDLLLSINLDQKVTIVMVTHNPDIECYADRILYLEDGRIIKQVHNYEQRNLKLQDYKSNFPPHNILGYLQKQMKESARVAP